MSAQHEDTAPTLNGFSVILLAAGQSRRMGKTNKLLLARGNVPLIRHTAQIYTCLGMSVTVVLGFEAEKIRSTLNGLPVEFIHNEKYADGQDTSIRSGLAALRMPQEGLLIALADQPLLEPADIKTLCAHYLAGSRDKIIVPFHKSTRGNPVLFPTELAVQIRDAVEAISCRQFIDETPQHVSRYDAPNDHFIADIDTPQDAAKVLTGRAF